MAEVLPTTLEHFVLVYKQGEGYIALDPWENEERPFALSEAQSWRLLTKVDSPQPDPKGRVGLHLQQEIGDWRGLSAVTIPMKFLAGIQNIATVKQINGEAFPVWRQWVPNQGIYLEAADKDAAASAYLDTFRDSMEEVLEEIARTVPGLPWPWFGVESLNETYAHGDPSVITNSIPFDRAWIRALAGYPEISPVVYCAAVGNIELPLDIPSSQVWKDLVELGKAGEAQHAAWGYHCFSADTEILTEQGWMLLSDIVTERKGIPVATLNRETGGVEYQVPTEYWEHEYNGPMIHLFGKADTLVTPNHRMWIRTHWKNVQLGIAAIDDHLTKFEFREARQLPYAFEVKRDLGNYEGEEMEWFILPERCDPWRSGQQSFWIEEPEWKVKMDDWLQFFGYWITEGHVHKNRIAITQKRGSVCKKIGRAMHLVGLQAKYYPRNTRDIVNWSVANARMARYLSQFGKSHDKFIPREFLSLSKRQLKILYDVMMEGDGCKDGKSYCSASEQLARGFQELTLKLGYAATLSQHCDDYWYVSIAKKRKTPMTGNKYMETLGYRGKVYCITVPNSLIFVQRNGKPSWQGNSYWYANPAESGLVSDWDYLAGRWTLFDDYLTAHGAHVNWFFGECGAVGGYPWPGGGYNLFPNDGWRASTCYQGNWPRYEQDLMLFNSLVQEWNATHGGRALGGTIFTTGGAEKWKWFEIGEQQINRLIAALS